MTAGQLSTTPLERDSLPLQVATQLEASIATKGLAPGERLPPERELALQLGVARPVVREAIRILIERGLLRRLQGSGTYVQEFTPAAFMQSLQRGYTFLAVPDCMAKMWQLRQSIEPAIAGLVASHASEEARAQLHGLVAAMQRSRRNRARFAAVDRDFHLALAGATGNELFAILLEPLYAALDEYMGRALQDANTARLAAIADRHATIVAAIDAGDAEAARAAMQRHFDDDPLPMSETDAGDAPR